MTMTITVEQLANELNISRNTAYNLTKKKGFPAFKLGGRTLINVKALQEWIDRKTESCYTSSDIQHLDN